MLEVVDVHKAYSLGKEKVAALRGVSLGVDEPEFIAIMGRSGSGKSTLLHLIAGLDQPDRGDIRVNETNIAKASEAVLTRFRRNQVGIVFQKFNLISTMTAFQNVALPAVLDGRSREWIDRRVNELFEQLELTGRANHRPDAMSGGEQQRVAIARAMLFEPKLILADEPTGNLDSSTSAKIWALLRDIAQTQQITVLMVTHEPAAAAYCHHVYVLADGLITGKFEVNGLDASAVATRYQQLGG